MYIYSNVYDYIGEHTHLINSITGMNQLKIIIVIIALISNYTLLFIWLAFPSYKVLLMTLIVF
jgi:hypothetical protein